MRLSKDVIKHGWQIYDEQLKICSQMGVPRTVPSYVMLQEIANWGLRICCDGAHGQGRSRSTLQCGHSTCQVYGWCDHYKRIVQSKQIQSEYPVTHQSLKTWEWLASQHWVEICWGCGHNIGTMKPGKQCHSHRHLPIRIQVAWPFNTRASLPVDLVTKAEWHDMNRER